MSGVLHSSKTWHGPPPPMELTNNASSLQLLSQGAEARVWLVTLTDPSDGSDNDNIDGGGGRTRTIHVGSGINVPQLLGFSQRPSPLSPRIPSTNASRSTSLKIVCKERFPKKYRHPQLDASLTKSRTKGEARSLIRCQRADVPCTNVLAIAHLSNKSETTEGSNDGGKNEGNGVTTSTTSSCLFLEYVEGCTVRQYFERRSGEPPNKKAADSDKVAEPETKRLRCEEHTTTTESNAFEQQERITTVIDPQTLCVAHTIGTLVAKMHAAGVIHGDLTTSNVMIRNPPWLRSDGDVDDKDAETPWTPRLVLIDFGLATSTTSANSKVNNSSGNKKGKPQKQQHNAEEKAVDLYVLERAFLSTHPESELLVEEVWKGYRGCFEDLDSQGVDASTEVPKGEKSDAMASSCSSSGGVENGHGYLAKAVLNRLEQVRMRGRKRECFG